MGLIGSLVGGMIGLTLAGPLGAVLGAALGHGLGGGNRAVQATAQQKAQAMYFTSVFSMLAKMARADGRVTQEEIDLTTDFMRRDLGLDSQSEKVAINIFRAAKDSPSTFQQFAHQFYGIFRADKEMLYSMLDLLHRLAMADGRMTDGERHLLKEAADIFGLSDEEARHVVGDAISPGDEPYAVLGVSPNASMDEVKKRYRKLVTEFHPDKVMAKGMPEEFVQYAETRFREIQEAYESIRRTRSN